MGCVGIKLGKSFESVCRLAYTRQHFLANSVTDYGSRRCHREGSNREAIASGLGIDRLQLAGR